MTDVGSPRPHVLVNHISEPPNRITGVTKYTFELMKALVTGGAFTYTLATTWDEERLPPELRAPNIDVVTVPFRRSAAISIAFQTLSIPLLARRKRASLVFHPTPLGSFLDRLPRVVTAHDLYYETNPEEYMPRRVRFWAFVFPKILASARAIIAVSTQTKDDIARFYPDQVNKVRVVPEAGGLDASQTASPFSPPHGGPYGLLVGNLTPNKNAPAVVEALHILAGRGVDATVYHVGRDENGVLPKEQPGGRPDRLFSLGTLSDEGLATAYASAAFLVAPSTREGFCLPVLEAQGFGVPVIAGDIPVLREVAGDGAIFVNPKRPEEIAYAIQRLLSDASFRSQLSDAARDNAGRFSWARAARETEAVFAAALAGPGQ